MANWGKIVKIGLSVACPALGLMFAAKSCTNDDIKLEARAVDIFRCNLPEGQFNENFAKECITNSDSNFDNYGLYQKGDTIWAYNKTDKHVRYQFIRVENPDQLKESIF
jgi:hypothetical protein